MTDHSNDQGETEAAYKLRKGAPLLTDIPGQLRNMANLIESGEYTGNKAVFILVDEDTSQEDWPKIFGWGEAFSSFEMIGMLDVCKTWFGINKTKRFT